MITLILLQLVFTSSCSITFSSASFLNAAVDSATLRITKRVRYLDTINTSKRYMTDYTVEVSLDDEEAESPSYIRISVQPEESILHAVERQVSWFLPSDCRRGNCLTCAALHAEGSVQSNLIQEEDGLSPQLSEVLRQQNFILACSSYVVGDGVKLQLGKNYAAWDRIYQDHMRQCDDVQRVCQEASAKAMRRAAETNMKRWLYKTELSYNHSTDD